MLRVNILTYMTVVEKLWIDILKVVMGVTFKPSYMLANPNLINGEISCLFVAYMESWYGQEKNYFR